MSSRSFDCLFVGVALCLIFVTGAAADTLVTGPVDQAGFQALVDAADPGDTISCLGGVYDFSAAGAVLLDKGLRIVAADPGDPPILVGDGTTGTDPVTGNHGFAQAPGSFIDSLTIEGLHFQDFDRTLTFPNSNDISSPGCPQIPGAGAKRVEILDNTIRNSFRGLQVVGGPFEDYVVQGNDIETIPNGGAGIFIAGDTIDCPFDGSAIDLVRLAGGKIKQNQISGGQSGIRVYGSEETLVKDNQVSAWLFGILFGDLKAFDFPDDGPISLGTVKENTIDGALYGIIARGPTTITDAHIENNQIENNEMSPGLAGIALDHGANGFEVKSNDFSGFAIAEIYLGFDEVDGIPGEAPPNTFNNNVKARAGDRVLDFGVDNTVKIQ
jgi:hypothetical protein